MGQAVDRGKNRGDQSMFLGVGRSGAGDSGDATFLDDGNVVLEDRGFDPEMLDIDDGGDGLACGNALAFGYFDAIDDPVERRDDGRALPIELCLLEIELCPIEARAN